MRHGADHDYFDVHGGDGDDDECVCGDTTGEYDDGDDGYGDNTYDCEDVVDGADGICMTTRPMLG